jgi:hypothetical protein
LSAVDAVDEAGSSSTERARLSSVAENFSDEPERGQRAEHSKKGAEPEAALRPFDFVGGLRG